MVADDRKEIVSGNLRRAVFGQKGLQVQTLQRERHMAADLKGVHHLVPETFQVNAQNLCITQRETYKHKHFILAQGALTKIKHKCRYLPLGVVGLYNILHHFLTCTEQKLILCHAMLITVLILYFFLKP